MLVASRCSSLLLQTGLFSEDQISSWLAAQRMEGGSITERAVALGGTSEEVFLRALAEGMKVPFVRLNEVAPPPEVLEMLPAKAVYQYQVLPLEAEGGVLRVATRDPFRAGLTEALRLASGGRRIRFTLALQGDLEKAVKRLYGVGGETIERMLDDGRLEMSDDDALLDADLADLDEEASVVKFVNQIIWEAYKDGATDIHMEPMEKDLRIRYRIDGLLVQTPVPASLKRFQSAIISRLKVMSNMDIAEKRLPQDGRIGLRIRGEEIDIRVSTMPTVYGESVSLRLLLRQSTLFGMGKLGLVPEDVKKLDKIIHRPHGIVLVTGPTGSGKSTSLYTYLNTINSVDKRIITCEDPIEYEMAGINQIQMKPEIGLTFAVGLRHILRQDPDVIMIGEIRDKETSEIAIQAALTGHLVFSTLHTNDAASGFTRLLDMGVEPFLVASSIEAIVAQRLIRTLCPDCKRPKEMDTTYLREVQFPVHRMKEGTVFEAVGCEACRNSGYRGRSGIYEILTVTDEIRQLVVSREPASRIRAVSTQDGMTTLREDGWRKVLAGVTTIEEVLRVSEDAEEEVRGESSEEVLTTDGHG
ncbi:MAG: type II/IV secretion system protein [Verrucomicrobia bacterium]|nr:type II/IV secretion system protein [Verrucomicrobiota bacterium]MCH8528774.1 GspE/PulE family protein [Kiritimatiellia bacterium]